MTLERSVQLSWRLQTLMSVLIGQPVAVRHSVLTPAPGRSSDIGREVDFIYSKRSDVTLKALQPLEMLLPLSRISKTLSKLVNLWFSRVDRSRAAIDVYFGAQHAPPAISNLRFLTMIQAIESYHRSLGTGLYMPASAYEAALQHLLTLIPTEIAGDHRHSLKNRLKFGNEFSLRKRMTLIFSELPLAVRSRLVPDSAKFIGRVVDTRNYFTHYDESSKGTVFEGPQIHYAAERLRALLLIVILLDLGAREDALLDMMQRSRDLREILQQDLSL